MKLLAVSGFKRSGKDTLADYLIKEYNTVRVSFAGPLKDKVAEDFRIPRSWCDDPEYKEKPILTLPVDPQDDFAFNTVNFMFKEFRSEDGQVADAFFGFLKYNRGVFIKDGKVTYKQLYQTPRSLCILEGSTKRSVDSGYWVDQAIWQIKNKEDFFGSKLGIITDMRYKSEAGQLRKAFGEDLVTIRVNRFDVSTSQDPSEVDLNDYKFDHVIENKGTLEEFYAKVEALMDKIK